MSVCADNHRVGGVLIVFFFSLSLALFILFLWDLNGNFEILGFFFALYKSSENMISSPHDRGKRYQWDNRAHEKPQFLKQKCVESEKKKENNSKPKGILR